MAVDLCDLRWGQARRDKAEQAWVGDDWALITRFSMPAEDRYVREMTRSSAAATGAGPATTSATTTS